MSKITTFQGKLELLLDELQQMVRTLCYHKGRESNHYSHKCLIPDDEFKYNFPNSEKYIAELTEDYVYDNDGNEYSYCVEDIEILCSIVDHLVEKYSS